MPLAEIDGVRTRGNLITFNVAAADQLQKGRDAARLPHAVLASMWPRQISSARSSPSRRGLRPLIPSSTQMYSAGTEIRRAAAQQATARRPVAIQEKYPGINVRLGRSES
jgi:hypothetical protein